MILSVWKPIYHSSKVVRYDLMDKEVLLIKKGTSAYKVIWVCDNQECKTPDLKHSISACHLIKEKMCYNQQVCRSCQCTGIGNGRYGDNRKWVEMYDKEKVKKLKSEFSQKWLGDNNPSKKESVKIKKGQVIITQNFIEELIKNKNFELLELIKLDGKKSEFFLKCPKKHIIKKKYHNFTRKTQKFICQKCYYESIGLNLTDDEIEELLLYNKIVRALTAKTYKLNKNSINPNNLELGRYKYHLDHKYSVYEGFKNRINPKIISSKENLEVITAQQNLSKQFKCSITLKELIEKTKYLLIK